MESFKKQVIRKVYLIESYSNGVYQYKIGVSKNPAQRLKQHKTSNPNGLNVLFEFESNWPFKLETALKNMYQYNKIDGEWFTLSDDIVKSFINQCERIEDNFQCIYENSTYNF